MKDYLKGSGNNNSYFLRLTHFKGTRAKHLLIICTVFLANFYVNKNLTHADRIFFLIIFDFFYFTLKKKNK